MEEFEARNARAWDEDTVVSEPVTECQESTPDIGSHSRIEVPRLTRGSNFRNRVSSTSSLQGVIDSRAPLQTSTSRGGFEQRGQDAHNAQSPRYTRQSASGCHSTLYSASPETTKSRLLTRMHIGRAGSFRPGNDRNKPRSSTSQSDCQSSRQNSARVSGTKANWATTEGLVTSRRAKDLDERTTKTANLNAFLQAPNDNESYPAIGYFMWPNKDVQPSELLGLSLEKLDPIRLQYRVHIEEMIGEQCLKISCPALHLHPERWLTEAAEGIRAAVRHEKANTIAANPVYFVTPPTASAMKSIVRPSRIEMVNVERLGTTVLKKVWKILESELAGDNLSGEELLAWKNSDREALANSNLRRFEDHLIRSLMALAHDKGLMQMRVHFGRVILTRSKPAFKAGTMNFNGFIAMMNTRGMETEFDREIGDATIAMRLREIIIQSPDRFRPVPASISILEDVEFQETAVIVVKRSDGEQFRIEADLDKNLENMPGQYQIGAIRHFKNVKTNLRMQVETLDIERQVDYTLKVVSDEVVHELNKNLLDVTQDLVTTRSFIHQDVLGLSFPNINPKSAEGLDVASVTVRSTIQYMLKKTSYVVEISIDRQWDMMNTVPAPKIVASVSMFSQHWDWQMRSCKDSPYERVWSPDLSDFFDDTEDGSSRVAKFISEVEFIQSFLAMAALPEAYHMLVDEEHPDIYSADD